VVGLLMAWVALGVGQLVAGIVQPQASPVAAVGGAAIDRTPPAVKNFAISAFGSHDKLVLVLGILVVLAVFCAAIGIAAMRRLRNGYIGLAIFAAIGLAAVLTRPNAALWDVLPTLVGALAGAYVLSRLVRVAGGGAPRPLAAGGTAQAVPPRPPQPRDTSAPPDSQRPDFIVPADPAALADQPEAGPAAPSQPAQSQPAESQPAEPPPAPARPAPRFRSGPPSDQPRRPPWQPDRRRFLTASGLAVAAGGVAALAGRGLSERSNVSAAMSHIRFPPAAHPVPPLPAGVNLDINGLSPFVTPNSAFYRVDTALILPQVAPQTWQLRIHGMVEREITISYHELLKRPLIEDWITLCCVSNPVAGPYIGNAKWLGASLASLLRAARPKAGADQLVCTSTDGFTSGTPLATVLDGRDALLAVAMNGAPLPVAHGFPVRMVTPGLYGYVSATKWVTDIKVTTFRGNYAYWAQRGWSQRAPIKTESRIDVPGGGSVSAGPQQVAGVAWAQHKGIDAVHVRVDRGPWHQARLAAVPGIDTWRQWAWDWAATRGNHVIEARATDATGYTQTALQEPPEPNGASGYPSITVAVS
jgi:DMSO/TMAO reductase YedYZ molybdopterin-dependent catalytic subunit